MNYFIYTYIISLLTGRYELNKLTLLPMCGFIAQLVEHCTGIAEVTGSNPVEALNFFRLLLSSCLNWKIHWEDHSSLSTLSYCFNIFMTVTPNQFCSYIRFSNSSEGCQWRVVFFFLVSWSQCFFLFYLGKIKEHNI